MPRHIRHFYHDATIAAVRGGDARSRLARHSPVAISLARPEFLYSQREG